MSHLVKEIHSTLLDDSYYRIDHPSGLTILVMPKAGYSSAYALFGTKYGSIDTRFKRSDEADFTEVPEGIAHFLEHKLFESEDLDAFARYAKTGASAMRIRRLSAPAIFSPARVILRRRWRFCWILCSRLILRNRPCRRSRASSGRNPNVSR